MYLTRTTLPLCIAILLGAGLSAQTKYYVSPPGTELVEGNSSSSISLGYGASRVQQIDNSLLGSGLQVIRSIAWRRNNTAKPTAARMIDITILMAHSNFSAVTNTYASNYKTPPTAVFPRAKVNLDWSKPALLTPPEYDAVFPFKSIFIYNAADALLWETQTMTGTAMDSGYSQDWFSTAAATTQGLRPQVLGKGCTTGNGAMTLNGTLTANSTTLSFGWDVKGAPSSVPVSVYIGLRNPNVPLFCSTLHTDAMFPIPLGTTDANGTIPLNLTGQTWNSSFPGVSFYSQALAPDKNVFGASISNGLYSTTPRVKGGTAIQVKRTFTLNSSTAATGSTPSTSAVATRFN
ncbi:MAG: hypothetical protein ACYTGW_05470 [Planctomycetota bacterium]|jgi:hypothetical protein